MFLDQPPDADTAHLGSNYLRLWAWHPGLWDDFMALRDDMRTASTLTERDWAVLVAASVAQAGDSYCSYAWGRMLADLTDDDTAAHVLAGLPAPALTDREAALAAWARKVARDPNATTQEDVDALREVGLAEREIFEATAWVAFRLAVATVNDALGALPDLELADAAPESVRAAVRFGRPPSS